MTQRPNSESSCSEDSKNTRFVAVAQLSKKLRGFEHVWKFSKEHRFLKNFTYGTKSPIAQYRTACHLYTNRLWVMGKLP